MEALSFRPAHGWALVIPMVCLMAIGSVFWLAEDGINNVRRLWSTNDNLQNLNSSVHTSSYGQSSQTGVVPLVAYYQCFRRPKAVREVLRRFRLYHPDAPLFMANDGGDQALGTLAAEFRANYTYMEARRGDNFRLYMRTPTDVIAWLQGIIDSGINADWVLLLEDDVHVYNKISIQTLKHDVNGDNPGTRLPEALVKIIEQLRGTPVTDSHYGGCGGSILRGSFLRLLAWQGIWKQHIHALAFAYKGAYLPSDQLISALALSMNGTVGSYPGFAETWLSEFKERVTAGSVEVAHAAKDFYRKRLI